jgi:hypothetical protein
LEFTSPSELLTDLKGRCMIDPSLNHCDVFDEDVLKQQALTPNALAEFVHELAGTSMVNVSLFGPRNQQARV